MKQKTCKACKQKFTPAKPLQYVCDWNCAALYTTQLAEKRKRQDEANKRKEYREAKEKQKTKSDWIKEIDSVYNPYIRLRDEKAGLPCPSCGRYDYEIPNTPFGKWDCGHYLSKGSHPE